MAKTIAFVSYNGSGKTTLALDTVLYFAKRTKKPVVIAEVVYGRSALAARCDLQAPVWLSDLASTLNLEPSQWHGVSVVPMDYVDCQDLSAEVLTQCLAELLSKAELGILDIRWPHEFAEPFLELATDILIPAFPLEDNVENGVLLKSELGGRGHLLLNGAGWTEGAIFGDVDFALRLPYLRNAARLEGKLGKMILDYVLGRGWAAGDRGWWARLLRR